MAPPRLPPLLPIAAAAAAHMVRCRYSRAAAADELLGHPGSAVQLYAKAADLMLFLLTEVPQVAGAQPLLHPADRPRLARYYTAVKVRQASCMAALNEQYAALA